MKYFKGVLFGVTITTIVGLFMSARVTEDELKLCVPGTADTCTIVFDTNDGASNVSIQADSGQLQINNGPLTSSQITDSDIDLGTASDTSRITVGKADTSTLSGLTRKEGTIHYDTSQKSLLVDDGVDLIPVGAGSGSGEGGINTLDNPDAEINANNWTESGGTFTRTVATANVGLGSGSFSWDASAASQTLDSDSKSLASFKIIQNRLCTLNFHYKGGDANIKVGVHDGTNYLVEKTLEAQTNYAPSGHITFVCPSTGNMFVRFESTADAAVIYFDQVFLGTTVPFSGAIVTDWETYTAPGVLSNISNTVSSSLKRRVGDSFEGRIKYSVTGVATGNLLLPASSYLPSGLTVDTTKQPVIEFGKCYAVDADAGSTTNEYSAVAVLGGSGQLTCIPRTTSDDTTGDVWGTTVPFTWASGDSIQLEFSIPITQWAGSSIVFQPTADDLALGKAKTLTVTDNMTTPGTYTATYVRSGNTMHFWLRGTSYTAEAGTDTTTFNIDLTSALGVNIDATVMDATYIAATGYATHSSAGSTADGTQIRTRVTASRTGNTNLLLRTEDSGGDSSFFDESIDRGVFGASAPDGMSIVSLYLTGKVIISEWSNVGSVPPIGVSEASDLTVGLAGPSITTHWAGTTTCAVNCNACTHVDSMYFKIGDIVWFSMSVNLDPISSSSNYECDLSLPVASNFNSVNDAFGVCSSDGVQSSGAIFADSTGDRLTISIPNAPFSANTGHRCQGSYRVIK